MGDNHAETMTTAPFICGSCVTNIQQKGNSSAICFSEAPQKCISKPQDTSTFNLTFRFLIKQH